MSRPIDSFDLGGLRLAAGAGRRLELQVAGPVLSLGGERYEVAPDPLTVRIDVSRTTGEGYALRLAFTARLLGPCMRCLGAAQPTLEIEMREVDQPGGGEELESPYLRRGVLDVRSWVRDAVALSVPAQVLCRPQCAGLCATCGADLNLAGPAHEHPPGADGRWAALARLRLR
ncbi:MAG TPA: DUF177 domain-containing protein [Solirubrobacteraceae bacterium]|nr:DUF177 domain-containing protein [Solirubrobacteraceae bacterium]